MIKRYLVPNAPPPPSGVKYHHAVEAAGWLHVAGQLPTDAAAPSASLPEGIRAQAEQTFANVRTIVEAAGFSFSDTVFVRIYLSQFARDFDEFNKVYHRYFVAAETVPARTTIGVAALGRNALVEIDLVLYKSQRQSGKSLHYR